MTKFPPTDAEVIQHYLERIQALRAENERLRAALQAIIDGEHRQTQKQVIRLAQTALAFDKRANV